MTRGITTIAIVFVSSLFFACAHTPTAQEGERDRAQTAPAPSVVIAPSLELKYPPTDQFESADAMYQAYLRMSSGRSMQPPRMRDPAYREQLRDDFRKTADFAGEFVRRYPGHERALGILKNRWSDLCEPPVGLEPEVAEREIGQWLRSEARGQPWFEQQTRRMKAQVPLRVAQLKRLEPDPGEPELKPVVAAALWLASEGDSEGAGGLLVGAAQWLQAEKLEDMARRMLAEAEAQFPDTEAAKTAEGMLRRLQGVIGEPFELRFTDAITGNEVNVRRDLAGKVVVVDFWATWCGPCVSEMPQLKALFDRYSERGVTFVGISLDLPEAQGGKEKLLQFVKEHDMRWPQYYQGNHWDSDFSRSWGIDAVPTHFVLDKQGRIHTTSARTVEALESAIEQLLAQ